MVKSKWEIRALKGTYVMVCVSDMSLYAPGYCICTVIRLRFTLYALSCSTTEGKEFVQALYFTHCIKT